MHGTTGRAHRIPSAELVPASEGRKGVRASNAEREMVARIINLATAEGMLTLDEADERLRLTYAAMTRDELAPLTEDLPARGRRLLENTPEARATTRSHARRHAVSMAGIAALLVGIWLATSIAAGRPLFFWPIWPIAFMAFSVASHARRTRWR